MRGAAGPGGMAVVKCLAKFMTDLALLLAVMAVANAESIIRFVRVSRM